MDLWTFGLWPRGDASPLETPAKKHERTKIPQQAVEPWMGLQAGPGERQPPALGHRGPWDFPDR